MHFRLTTDKLIILVYFTGLILLGSGLLVLPGVWLGPQPFSYIDALFTSTSAVCVTGLITVDTALYSVFGQTVIALMIQFGGLGIITFATIYIAIPRRKISLMNRGMIKDLYMDEVESNPKTIVKHILTITLFFETLGGVVLFFRFRKVGTPRPAFDAAFHAVSAFCNAGFSTFSDSLEKYVLDPWVNLTILFLLISGGIGFLVLQDIGKVIVGRKRRLSDHSRIALYVTAVLLLVGTAFFYVAEYDSAYAGLPVMGKLMAALFQSATPRTAGFDTIPQGALSASSLLVVMILMFIGGSPGSTAGGVKTTTLFVAASAAFRKSDMRGGLQVKGRSISPQLALKSFSVLGKAFIIVILSTVCLLVTEADGLAMGKVSFMELVFESISAFGTVGLSLGATLKIGTISKLILILTMFAGRVGLFTMSLPVQKAHVDRFTGYPEANLMIG
jgi:trk system potassium uptake protein